MRTSEANPSDWYHLAEDRLRAADASRSAAGVTFAGVELLHEAVERYLKGYLVSSGWVLRRTHDLGELLAVAIGYNQQLTAFQSLADNLTDQFWAQHYPGGDLSAVGLDYDQVRQEVGTLVHLLAEPDPSRNSPS